MVCPISVLLIGVLITVTSARRADLDFEFDEATIGSREHVSGGGACGRAWCGVRDVCVLRAGRATCVGRHDLRPGDTLVASSSDWERDDDVFYDGGADDATTTGASDTTTRCVTCERRAGPAVCGSNNRTYSSLCRLDLRNCVRGGAPVTVACRGACPCQRRRGLKTNAVSRGDTPRARRRRPTTDAAGCAMGALADRLLDWFAVLMDEAGETPPHAAGFPRECKPEVRWMFTHLDSDSNNKLSARELYALRHDDRERCLRPFLSSCSAGASGGITRAAWCGCLRRAQRPCTALTRNHALAPPGSYVPSCDARGFYRPRQCHPALGVCWCVTQHGVELPGSRTKGAPACTEELDSNSISSLESAGAGAAAGTSVGAPDDDEDAHFEGSGRGGFVLD